MSIKHRDSAATARALQALALRKQGEQWQAIAHQCGYADKGSACNAVNNLLASVKSEDIPEYRALQSQRLDDALKAIYRMAMGDTCVDGDGNVIIIKPDLWALDRLLRIIELQCKLYGLFTDAAIEAQASPPLILAIGISQEALDRV